MDDKEKQLLQRLLSLFKIEAGEHLKAISSGLIELEKAGPEKQPEILEVIYREAHSLKGAARSVNLQKIAALCQSMENVFSALKGREIQATIQLFDVLHKAVDKIESLSTAAEEKTASGVGALVQVLENVIKKPSIEQEPVRVEKEETSDPIPEPPSLPIPDPRPPTPDPRSPIPGTSSLPLSPSLPSSETIRISTHKLDSILFQAEELLTVKITSGQRLAELREMRTSLNQLKKEWSGFKRSGEPLFLSPFEGQLTTLLKAAEYDHRSLGGMVDSLLDEMKKILMLPFSTLSDQFPKVVREISREMGKEAEMIVTGGEIEVDRRVLEEMKDPLTHMVRNCLDHGIEKVGERKRKKKPVRGKILLTITSKNGNKLEIVLSDDGAGIEATRLKTAALQHGLLSREEIEKLSEGEVTSLIFRSGLTTSPIITELSGRGLGLAIVREKVEKLGGRIEVESGPDAGTLFRMVIPLTLATFRGVLVTVSGYPFILPTNNVERVVRTKKEEIKTVENRETVLLDGRVLSLTRLEDVLELGSGVGGQGSGIRDQGSGGWDQGSGSSRFLNTDLRSPNPDPYLSLVVLGSAEKRMAFQVDAVLQEREVLVKPLGNQLSRVRNIAGATVLEGGVVVPILNVVDILKSAVRVGGTPAGLKKAIIPEKRRSILVVEDSITARTLLKNILSTVGYAVRTTVDGLDAVAALRTQKFDLVVSDIQMPRMDGFDLVENIRGNNKFPDLPVILVTSLESDQDRRRGIEVGANAYIVKSSFDQSNLLEVVRRLI
ncbi:MAG: response regulator [Deltaproteobacteria bacterium]|nr:response regulator [Deltaproteobacteria bacterium]